MSTHRFKMATGILTNHDILMIMIPGIFHGSKKQISYRIYVVINPSKLSRTNVGSDVQSTKIQNSFSRRFIVSSSRMIAVIKKHTKVF